MNLAKLSKDDFVSAFKNKAAEERRATAEVIEFVKEGFRRRIHLDYGLTSIHQFMVEILGYPNSSAQRRIDAAMILFEIPELNQNIRDGSINLTQVAFLAKAIREKEKTSEKTVLVEEKREIIEAIKCQRGALSQQTICKLLDIAPITIETKKVQADGSVRREITFTKEQESLFEEIQSLLSHSNPGASFTETFEVLAQEFKKRKFGIKSNTPTESKKSISTVEMKSKNKNPGYISPKLRREVFQEQKSCRWKHEGKLCESKFQLQVDHIKSLWAGGNSRKSNLQLLCSIHNRLKYENEKHLR